MRTTRHSSRPVLRALPLLLAAACASHARTDDGAGGTGTYTPLECGRGSGSSAHAEIGEEGGTVSVAGHTLRVPPRAVGARTRFRITEWASGYVGVEVEPDGARFTNDATLTLSYARCPGSYRGLRIVHVRDQGKTTVETLTSTVDHEARTVTAGLRHLSGYLIGGNRDGGT